MAWILPLLNLGLILTVSSQSTPATPTTKPSPTGTADGTTSGPPATPTPKPLPTGMADGTTSSPPATPTPKPSPTGTADGTTSGPPATPTPKPSPTGTADGTTSGPPATPTPKPSPTGTVDGTTSGPPATPTPKPSPTGLVSGTTSSPPATITSKPTPTVAISKTTPGPPATTTQSVIFTFSINFHIKNKVFNSSLQDLSSPYSIQLKEAIGIMYNNVYNCNVCYYGYTGYHVISFSPGSVVVESLLYFKGANISGSLVQQSLIDAKPESTAGLQIGKVTVRSSTSSSSEAVPGWGIALLVLVCILVFFLLLGLLWLLIHYCRRNHRGSMELLSSRDSYHPMNEYPTYQTHSRFVAPGNKQNPYDEGRPKNGTKPFSYTNPAMANDEL